MLQSLILYTPATTSATTSATVTAKKAEAKYKPT